MEVFIINDYDVCRVFDQVSIFFFLSSKSFIGYFCFVDIFVVVEYLFKLLGFVIEEVQKDFILLVYVIFVKQLGGISVFFFFIVCK